MYDTHSVLSRNSIISHQTYQDGFYHETAGCIVITLNPFRDPRVQREALAACRRFNARRIKTISGKVIEMHLAESI